MPSDVKKRTLFTAAAALSGDCSDAAKTPAGKIIKERIMRTENKRSRGTPDRALLRFEIMELNIVILL
jgi:hypothetical protein